MTTPTTSPTPDAERSEVTTALVLGGTGRTGQRALIELLRRGVNVRAIVRDPQRLPDSARHATSMSVTEASLLDMPDEQWARLLDGCDAVVCCLGHTISVRGVLGPPWRLVEQAVRRTATAASPRGARPLRVVLMSSVSVTQPGAASRERGRGQRLFLWTVRLLVPPARDNQRAADYLALEVGRDNPSVEWVVVRPDTLRDGNVSPYDVSAHPSGSLLRPERTRMANVGHLMAELATDDELWRHWRGQMPVVTDAA